MHQIGLPDPISTLLINLPTISNQFTERSCFHPEINFVLPTKLANSRVGGAHPFNYLCNIKKEISILMY